jgi:hypothetical protein
VKRLRLHPSQRIVSENKAEQTLVISMKLRLGEETESRKNIIDRNPELAFLLGRFGEDCKILSATPIR